MMKSSHIQRWTSTEDRLLLKLRNKKIPYSEIVELMTGRNQDALRNRVYVLHRRQPKWTDAEKVGFLDIEASALKADAGIMLSWAICDQAAKVKSDVITRKEILDWTFDRRIIKSLIDAMRGFDVLVTFYGSQYDLPFIRSRALRWRHSFPVYGDLIGIDLFYAARQNLELTRKSLDRVTTFLGCENKKTYFDIEIWNRAKYGCPKALKLVLEHNVIDVVVLLEVYEILKPFSKFTRRSI